MPAEEHVRLPDSSTSWHLWMPNRVWRAVSVAGRSQADGLDFRPPYVSYVALSAFLDQLEDALDELPPGSIAPTSWACRDPNRRRSSPPFAL